MDYKFEYGEGVFSEELNPNDNHTFGEEEEDVIDEDFAKLLTSQLLKHFRQLEFNFPEDICSNGDYDRIIKIGVDVLQKNPELAPSVLEPSHVESIIKCAKRKSIRIYAFRLLKMLVDMEPDAIENVGTSELLSILIKIIINNSPANQKNAAYSLLISLLRRPAEIVEELTRSRFIRYLCNLEQPIDCIKNNLQVIGEISKYEDLCEQWKRQICLFLIELTRAEECFIPESLNILNILCTNTLTVPTIVLEESYIEDLTAFIIDENVHISVNAFNFLSILHCFGEQIFVEMDRYSTISTVHRILKTNNNPQIIESAFCFLRVWSGGCGSYVSRIFDTLGSINLKNFFSESESATKMHIVELLVNVLHGATTEQMQNIINCELIEELFDSFGICNEDTSVKIKDIFHEIRDRFASIDDSITNLIEDLYDGYV